MTNGQVEAYYQAAGKAPWPRWLEHYRRLCEEIDPEHAHKHPAGLLPRPVSTTAPRFAVASSIALIRT